jgi:hypothetical protein
MNVSVDVDDVDGMEIVSQQQGPQPQMLTRAPFDVFTSSDTDSPNFHVLGADDSEEDEGEAVAAPNVAVDTTTSHVHPTKNPTSALSASDGDTQSEYEVERLVGHRAMHDHFLVKWANYPETENTWEPKLELPPRMVASWLGTATGGVPPAFGDDSGKGYEVERLVGHRAVDDHFLVKWANYPETRKTWEPKLGLPQQMVASWAAVRADHTGSQPVRVQEDTSEEEEEEEEGEEGEEEEEEDDDDKEHFGITPFHNQHHSMNQPLAAPALLWGTGHQPATSSCSGLYTPPTTPSSGSIGAGALAGAATPPVAMVTPTTSSAPNSSSHFEHHDTPNRDTHGVHTQVRPVACHCEDCDENPSRANVLKMAKPSRANILKKRKRTDEKPFACKWEGCGFRATRQGNLQKHKRTHTGEKPFACKWDGCGYRATDQSTLNTHERTHTDEKPFACQWEGCGYRTAQQGHLNTHERTHTGEKPFACQWEGCGYRAAQQGDLQRHERTHTGEKPFACKC